MELIQTEEDLSFKSYSEARQAYQDKVLQFNTRSSEGWEDWEKYRPNKAPTFHLPHLPLSRYRYKPGHGKKVPKAAPETLSDIPTWFKNLKRLGGFGEWVLNDGSKKTLAEILGRDARAGEWGVVYRSAIDSPDSAYGCVSNWCSSTYHLDLGAKTQEDDIVAFCLHQDVLAEMSAKPLFSKSLEKQNQERRAANVKSMQQIISERQKDILDTPVLEGFGNCVLHDGTSEGDPINLGRHEYAVIIFAGGKPELVKPVVPSKSYLWEWARGGATVAYCVRKDSASESKGPPFVKRVKKQGQEALSAAMQKVAEGDAEEQKEKEKETRAVTTSLGVFFMTEEELASHKAMLKADGEDRYLPEEHRKEKPLPELKRDQIEHLQNKYDFSKFRP